MRLVSPVPLIAIAITLSAATAILWGVTIAAPISHQAMADARMAAAAAWVSAVLCWLSWAQRRREEQREEERVGPLIRTLANVTRPAAQGRRPAAALRATLPFHRVP